MFDKNVSIFVKKCQKIKVFVKNVAVSVDFLPLIFYTKIIKWGEKMLDISDGKTLISAYKFIERTCNAIDEFIFKHAINYGPDPDVSSTYDVVNNIVDLMERKNKLIKLKQIIDDSIRSLNELDKKILILKMRFRISVKNLQAILKMSSERTAFRKIENALTSFTKRLNESKYAKDVEDLIENEGWILKIKHSLMSANARAI